MKIALAAALAAGVVASAPVALADDSAPDLRIGQAGTLVNGDVVQTWTISGLRESADIIPAPVAGTLWEATATSTAVAGTVIPVIPAFNARPAAPTTAFCSRRPPPRASIHPLSCRVKRPPGRSISTSMPGRCRTKSSLTTARRTGWCG